MLLPLNDDGIRRSTPDRQACGIRRNLGAGAGRPQERDRGRTLACAQTVLAVHLENVETARQQRDKYDFGGAARGGPSGGAAALQGKSARKAPLM